MDETTLTLLPLLRKCWMKKGQQLCIPTPGQQRWHHIFGAYNWRTDQIIWVTAQKKNSTSFIYFLEHLMCSLKTDKPIVLVLDNASYHHSQVSQAALACFEDRLMICWLPPYCSDLNPIERFWRHLKDYACANKLFANIDAIVQSVTRFLFQQNCFSNSDRFLFAKSF